MHSALFYRVAAMALPAFLIAPAVAGRLRWTSTAGGARVLRDHARDGVDPAAVPGDAEAGRRSTIR
jgi:hypothetical protein